jgi:hypothetical protein
MALLFCDPCGAFYSTTAQAASGLYTTCSATIATSGLPSGNIESTAFKNVGSLVVPTTGTSGPYFVGFRFIPTQAIPAGGNLFIWQDNAAGQQVTLQTNTNGTITAKRGSGNGTVLGTSSPSVVLTQNVWCFIEFGLTCNGSTGTVDIRINGTSVLSLSGQNTQGSATATIGSVQFLDANATSYHQDIYICDSTGSHNTTFLGDVQMPVSYANANGTYTAWTANGAASIYQSVNATTPADSTVFASDSTPTDRMSVSYPTTSVTGTIVGVAHVSRMEKSTSGTRTVSQVITNNGNDQVASAQSLGTSYKYYQQISEQDPNTLQPWTQAGFNTIQSGLITES